TTLGDNPKYFLQIKPASLLISIRESEEPIYVSILAKKTDCTYSHAIAILKRFQDMGIVDFERIGRVKLVRLTPMGIKVADSLVSFVNAFNMGQSIKPAKTSVTDEISARISEYESKIERVFKEEIEGKSPEELDVAVISRRLAPYKREIRKLKDSVREENILKELNRLEARIDEILRERDRLVGDLKTPRSSR
ncbi:MAG: hypothetical protein DRO11_09740, partial [Methanobacteriota archaeon]